MHFGIANVNVFFNGWWTLFIIIPSFVGLFKSYNKTSNTIFLLIGLTLLLSAQGVIDYSVIMKLMLPAILVIIGFSFIFGNILNETFNKKIKSINKDGLVNYTSTFSGQTIVIGQNENFDGANVDAIFGGAEIDLRNANITEDKVINATAIFGGVEIYVPSNINVKVKSTAIFGGVTSKAVQTKGENIPTIYINGLAMFGGVEIK